MKDIKHLFALAFLFILFTRNVTCLSAHATEFEEPPLTTISFSKSTASIKVGKKFQFKVTTQNYEGNITYSVSDKKLASITSTGLFKAKKMGTVTITATAGDTTASTKVKIKGKKIVCIDPGHSSKIPSGTEPNGPGSSKMTSKDNYGTCGIVTKVPEYKTTLSISKQLQKLLKNRGYEVVMTRTNNTQAISCAQRAKVANKSKADIFVRIHVDGIDNSSVTGASGLYPTQANRYISKLSKKSKRLTNCILSNMCKCAGTKSRGIFGRDDLTGTNWAKMPVTLIEIGFASNPTEDRTMQKKAYQKKLAIGMADGIDTYFGY